MPFIAPLPRLEPDPAPPGPEAASAPSREAALRALIAERDRAWNDGDAAAWARAFTPDARVVTLRGEVREGRAMIEETCRRSLAGRRHGSRSHTTIERISFPAANVAQIDVLRLISRPGPEALSSRARMRLLAVRANGGDAWQLAAAQSTPLPPDTDAPAFETTLI